MSRKLPIIPTILVALAVATMIGLGIWQLERRKEKEALLATYAAAANRPPIGWPSVPPKEPLPLFRSATGNCLPVVGFRTAAGQNQRGEPGYLIIADCRTGAEGPGLAVELGWSKNPNAGPRLSRRAGQRRDRARPDQPDAAGRGDPGTGLDGQRAAVARHHPQQSFQLCHPMVPVRRHRGRSSTSLALRGRWRKRGDDQWLS